MRPSLFLCLPLHSPLFFPFFLSYWLLVRCFLHSRRTDADETATRRRKRRWGGSWAFDIFCPENRQIRDDSGVRERVGGWGEHRGTSASDVEISVRHCGDVTIVNTHSNDRANGWWNYWPTPREFRHLVLIRSLVFLLSSRFLLFFFSKTHHKSFYVKIIE